MNKELINAVIFFGLNIPIKNKIIIKNRFKQLSMKYHPDRGGNEDDFKLLLEYREILEKNFDCINRKDNKINYFSKSKKNTLFLEGNESYKKYVNIFYKIYFEGVCYKAIIFFIFLLILSKGNDGFTILFIGMPIILLISIGVSQSLNKAIKSLSIFLGIGIYIFSTKYTGNYSLDIDGNIFKIIFYSLLIAPITLTILSIYGKKIFNIIKKYYLYFYKKINLIVNLIINSLLNIIIYILKYIFLICIYSILFISTIITYNQEFNTLLEPNIVEKGYITDGKYIWEFNDSNLNKIGLYDNEYKNHHIIIYSIEKLDERKALLLRLFLKVIFIYFMFILFFTFLYKKIIKKKLIFFIEKNKITKRTIKYSQIYYFLGLYLFLYLSSNIIYLFNIN